MLVQVQGFREKLKVPQVHLHGSSVMKPAETTLTFKNPVVLLDLYFQFRAQQLNKPWAGGAEQTEDVFEALARIKIGALLVEDMNDSVRV